jgi:hypothetical protein
MQKRRPVVTIPWRVIDEIHQALQDALGTRI